LINIIILIFNLLAIALPLGVFVNGRRIETHVLNDGDVVQVSQTK
jgi:pSer/pThr/pTyr-binding forkhead associated (FHA) protein